MTAEEEAALLAALGLPDWPFDEGIVSFRLHFAVVTGTDAKPRLVVYGEMPSRPSHRRALLRHALDAIARALDDMP